MRISRRGLIKSSGAVAGAAAVSSLPSRSFSARAQEKVKLQVWKAPHTTDDQKYFDGVLATFMQTNPNVEVEYRVTPWATWQETYTSAFASDSPPDLSYVVDSFFPKFSDAGALVDLSKLGGADLTKWQPLYDPSIWARGTRKGAVYGLPYLTGGSALVWNKKIFRDNGLDPETPPATWDELIGWAEKLTKSDGSQYGYATLDDTTGEALNFYPIPMVNYGGNLASDDNTKWLANSPGHIQGLQLQVDLFKNKLAPPIGMFVGHDLDIAFLDGKVAMQLSLSQFIFPHMKDYPGFELGSSVPPAGPLNNQSVGGVGYWMMAEKSKHKPEAWALMEYLTSAEVMTGYCKLSGLFQTRTDVDPFSDQPLVSAFAKTQKNYTLLPSMPFDYWTILNPEAIAAFSGQESAEDALNKAASVINDRLAQS